MNRDFLIPVGSAIGVAGVAQFGPVHPVLQTQEPLLSQTPLPEQVVVAWQNVHVGKS